MKFVIFFLSVLTFSKSNPVEPDLPDEDDMYRIKELTYIDENGQYQTENLEGFIPRSEEPPVVMMYLYTRDNLENPDIISGQSTKFLSLSHFKPNKPNAFIVHGWKNNFNSSINTNVRPAILKYHDVNVFVVDWSDIAQGRYLTSYSEVENVGNMVGDFLVSLTKEFGIKSHSFQLIGHSLGAQICGCAGARFNKLTGRLVRSIVGLDPAGPLFTKGNIENRIDPSDGEYVEIIHTNGGRLGFYSACGHADYYPNGGRSQPGCGLDITGICAHSRAYIYYAESISGYNFIAWKCESKSDYRDGECDDNHVSFMGGFKIDEMAHGTYFLDTNSEPNFARGL